MTRVGLRFAEARYASIRELTGFEERAISGIDTRQAVALIDALCACAEGAALQPGTAIELTAYDRDRILAVIYRQTYGARIASVTRCAECGAYFDFELSLEDLIAQAEASRVGTGIAPPYRLPTGRDELDAVALPPKDALGELARRCSNNAYEPGADELDAALAAAAPVLDFDLLAPCAECSAEQLIVFDMQAVLLSALREERRLLGRELHVLARSYGWPLHELLSLPRSERRLFVELVADDVERAG